MEQAVASTPQGSTTNTDRDGLCPACGGALEEWRRVPGGEPADAQLYLLLRCGACGTAVTAEEPPSPDLYERGAYSPTPPRLQGVLGIWRRFAARQPIAFLRRAGLRPGARVLDAGAGTGWLVSALERAGFDARGIDSSKRSAGRAQAAGSAVQLESILEHEEADLDAVVLWHVLEHLDDPKAVLARVRGWLSPGGLLLIGVPNIDSLQARLAGERWLHLDAPRHRTHLTPAGLSAMLEAAGFAPGRTHHMIWEHNPGSMWMALLARLGVAPGLAFHVIKRNTALTGRRALALSAGAALLPAALTLEAVAAGAGRGGTMALVAQRTELPAVARREQRPQGAR